MNTALLLFAIWLIGVLISVYVIYKALRLKCTTTVFDYAIGVICALLSWIFLFQLLIYYVVHLCRVIKKAYRKMKGYDENM